MFKLVIEDEEGRATEIPLVRGEVTIGRREGNTVRLPEQNVSRRHARIVKDNGQVFLEDAGSRYGIRVNGARIEDRIELKAGDYIRIGDYQIALALEGEESFPVAPQTVPRDDGDDERGGEYEQDTAVVEVVSFDRPPSPAPPPPAPGERDGERSAALLVISSNVPKQAWNLTAAETLIGREGAVDVLIGHASMSRTHAKVLFNGKVWSIVDQGSANGVLVNGDEVGARDLRNGDVVQLGEVKLRFVRRDQTGELEGKVADYKRRQERQRNRNLLAGLVGGVGLLVVAVLSLWPDGDVAVDGQAGGEGAVPAVDPLEEALQKARGFLAIRDWNAALRELDVAFRLDPGSAAAERLRTRARSEALAKQTFEEVRAAITAGDVAVLDAKLLAIAEDSVYRGEAAMEAALLMQPRVEHHVARGDAAREEGRLEEALANYEAALRADPGAVLAQRGAMLVKLRLRHEAKADAPLGADGAGDGAVAGLGPDGTTLPGEPPPPTAGGHGSASPDVPPTAGGDVPGAVVPAAAPPGDPGVGAGPGAARRLDGPAGADDLPAPIPSADAAWPEASPAPSPAASPGAAPGADPGPGPADPVAPPATSTPAAALATPPVIPYAAEVATTNGAGAAAPADGAEARSADVPAAAGAGEAGGDRRAKGNQAKEAALAYNKARTLLPKDPKAAVALLRRALRLDPKTAKPHRLLGNYYAEQGKPKAACKHLTQYLKLSPNAPDGPAIREQLGKFGCPP